MFLYLWVNKYKHITKTGFNLSSNYEFTFAIKKDSPKTKEIVGNLTCVKKRNPKIFHKDILDIRAIIGENGSGKSTLLEILIQNIMTKPSFYFDGFIITDDYIFNRKGIDFGDSISSIKYFDLKVIPNVDLVNFKRDQFQKKLKANEVLEHYEGQIATSHLNHVSIIHYSPLLNIDRIANIEGVAGSSRTWETNYWHYYDLTTENCIVDDYHSYNIGEISYFISGESELLTHKHMESKRNLEFLSDEVFAQLPFKNRINEVTVSLNDFYKRFWESIDRFLKADDELEGRLQQVISAISIRDFKKENAIKRLESNLYVAFIYAVLKYEYKFLMNGISNGRSNALLATIEKFLKATERTRIHKTTLRNFLQQSGFAGKYAPLIFSRINKAVELILKSKLITDRSEYDFTLSLKKPEVVKEFIKVFYDDFVFGKGEDETSFIFHIFSIDFAGLSSGEKNLLSMFSRIKRAAETIPPTQTEVVFLLDEPEVTLHPQWQIKFINLVNDNFPKLFSGMKLQIIISSHSPILVSDLPKNNILFLEKGKDGECKVSDLRNMEQTFGANIHTLYADSFFLEDKGGAMGEFSKEILKGVIAELKGESPRNPQRLKNIIDLIGEPLIQNQILEMFYSKFPEQRIENIDERIAFLEEQLKTSKEIKQNSGNENN